MGLFDDGVGGFFSGLLGSKNKERAGGYNVDQNAYNYGGSPTGARDAANRYKNAAEWGQTRQAVNVNYDQANEDRARALQARGQQEAAANLMMQRATGQAPSIARMAANRQMQQVAGEQASAAASARGAGAIALAQQQAAANTAAAQGNVAGQAQINEANERLAAEQAAFGAFSGMRGLDYQGQGQAAQQTQYQAGLEAQQRGLNDQFSLGMTGFEHGVNQTQLGAQMQREAQQSANNLGAQGINAGVGGQNAAMNQANGWGAINAGASVAGAGGSGGPKPRAAGGPVAPGEAYIVGEQGPEIIVPQHEGTVIPAEQTAQVLSTSSLPGATYNPAQARERGAGLVRMANATESPWARDVRQVRTLRQVAPNLVNDEDEDRERRGLLVVQGAKREAAAEKKSETPAKKDAPLPQQSRIGALGGAAGNVARSIDTSYRGPSGGYAPPPMVVLPAPRAMGGPMTPGMPYQVGEQGPELVLPGRSIAGMAPAAASPSFAGGSGMLGGSPMGELKAHSDFATRFQRQGGASPMAYGGAREHGGPVGPKKAYLVGERGPEMVMPADTISGGLSLRDRVNRAELGEISRMANHGKVRDRDVEGHTERESDDDRARTKRAFQDQWMADADARMAGYKQSLNQGAAVAPVVEIDQEPAPWLTAFMAAQQEPAAILLTAREEGGPISTGQPTLVGEKGPEMVVSSLPSAGIGGVRRLLAAAPGVGSWFQSDDDVDENSSKPLAEGPSNRIRRMKKPEPKTTAWSYQPQVKR